MKQFTMSLITPIALALSAFSASTFASGLNGQTMNCKYSDSLNGFVETDYRFLQESDEVLIHSSIEGRSVADFSVHGSLLTITTSEGDRVYNISNPHLIVRNVKDCVFPGVPDGDSQSVCDPVVERCVLSTATLPEIFPLAHCPAGTQPSCINTNINPDNKPPHYLCRCG